MVIKDSLHQLVEELPEEELSTALRFLQYLKDVGNEPFVDTVMSESEVDPLDLLAEGEDQEISVADAWQKYYDARAGTGSVR